MFNCLTDRLCIIKYLMINGYLLDTVIWIYYIMDIWIWIYFVYYIIMIFVTLFINKVKFYASI